MSWRVAERMTIYHESGMYALSPTLTRTPLHPGRAHLSDRRHPLGGAARLCCQGFTTRG